ncbi:MAG TPA: HGGxSTG domain-containing protein [Halomonas sp.]|nr:HGGxSTG domain-containing protein [Halomonas sp.]
MAANTEQGTQTDRGPINYNKLDFNPNADEKNFVGFTREGKPFLACGALAKNKRKGDLCHMSAGQGTAHVGYGRCKYHGGNNTGPKTAEGKAKAAENSRIHGFYSAALSKEEAALFEELKEKQMVGLEYEIYTLKAKILTYLTKWRQKWDAIADKEGEEQADKHTRVWYATGENGQGVRSYYQAGSIDDRALDRALNTLGKLVEKQGRLTQGGGEDLLGQINKELQEASYGQVSVSWGGRAQTRKEGGPANEPRQ